ncbi:MAG: hypothetical protein L3J65_01415 [Robiginitomaculum sp.]|nr:hypothetical protein [Robiginitomaculum sp.]
MSEAAYLVVTAQRASDLIYELCAQSAQDIRPGVWPGIWIVPDNVCPAVPLALACAGADLRFIDISAESLCLDTNKVAELAGKENIAGVVYVRTFGMNAFAQQDLANLRTALPDAILIDDCCIDIPQTQMPKTQNAADVILYSTGYGKTLDLGGGAYGFFKPDMGFKAGGPALAAQAFEALLTQSNEAIKGGVPIFANYDFTAPGFSVEGIPPAQDWLEYCKSIKVQLPDRLAHKAKLNAIYANGLAPFSPLADDFQNWRFHIFVQNQEQVLEALFSVGLFASSHYTSVSKLWDLKPGAVSQKIEKNIINLFNDQHFSAKQARQAVGIINEIGKPLR